MAFLFEWYLIANNDVYDGADQVIYYYCHFHLSIASLLFKIRQTLNAETLAEIEKQPKETESSQDSTTTMSSLIFKPWPIFPGQVGEIN